MKQRKTLTLIVTILTCITISFGAYAVIDHQRISASVLAQDALRTNASHSTIHSALQDVYTELKRSHFLDDHGRVNFPETGSTDRSYNESVERLGDFVKSQVTFEDFRGRRIDIRTFHTPDMNTLVVWEYADGADPQEISVALQIGLGKRGVRIN